MAKIQDKIGAIRTVLAVVLVGFVLPLAPAQEHTTTVQQEIARHEQSLADARAATCALPQAIRTCISRNSTPSWSLDGVMRYLPMATMYDGKQCLAERFNNVLVSPESYRHMSDAADAGNANLHMLAMGLSRSYGGLPALPSVVPELESVVRDAAVAESHGPLEGRLLSN
jgi:CHAT domain-containing protein